MGVWWEGADDQPNVTGIVQPSGGSSDGGPSNDLGGFIGEGWGGNPPEEPAPSPLTWGPSQAVEDEYDEPDPVHEAQTQADINAIIQNMQEAGTYTATPGPAEGTGLPEIVNENIIQPVIGGVGDFWNQYMSGSMLAAPWKMLKYPKAKQFTMYGNQNDLAIIKSLLLNAEGELDPTKVDIYYEKYKDIINEGLKTDMKEVEEERGGTTSDEFWDKKFEEQGNLYFKKALASAPDKGAQGEESQRRLDKVSFYGGDDEDWVPPQTTGGLEQLAGEAIITGENLSPEEKAFNQKVFNARNELDRQTGGQGGGGGAGIMGAVPTPFTDVNNNGILDSLEVAQATTVPAAAATTTPAATTMATATEPTPFDYSQWPQFTSAYPGYNQYPWPNYVNQGLGQWPNFDYFTQVAQAFPGMRNYYG